MGSSLIFLWVLTGGAIATAIMIHRWLPDPPPDLVGKFVVTLIVGVIGGVVGGALLHSLGSASDPMPGIWGALTGGLILSGGLALFITKGRKAAV
jgi:hypothetical protein